MKQHVYKSRVRYAETDAMGFVHNSRYLIYFEEARTNAEIPSSWWDRWCQWQFQKIGIPMKEAHLLWEPTKPQIIQALKDDSRRLQNDLYKWKISNLERVESIKKQVEIFTKHIDEVKGGQQDLF